MIDKTDSYNASHFKLYPPGTTQTSGYIEARNSSIFERVSFFGLQYFIKKYLLPSPENIDLDYYETLWKAHGEPFNREGWQRIKDLGYYPLEIQAVPEGSWIHKGNVLVQVRSTDPLCYWLPTWIETKLVQVWYPTAVATVSKKTKIIMRQYLKDTGCENIDGVLPFMLHDFGYRGASSEESAALGGAAHLTNFMGTDTFPAIELCRNYYGSLMPGYSIPASNHAVITSWGNEEEAFQNVLDQYLGEGTIVACVSDSYNFSRAVESWGTRFRKQIEDSGGRLVVRPDSGSPEHITLEGLTKLMKSFGYTTNTAGYRVLPDCVRMIWGDGINWKKIDQVLYYLQSNGIAAENICFGMGSALLQEVRRDDIGMAFKINERITNGERFSVFKNPVTGKGKASKAGRQALINCDGYYITIPEDKLECRENVLRTVYLDGKLLIDDSLETIRNRATESGFNLNEYGG